MIRICRNENCRKAFIGKRGTRGQSFCEECSMRDIDKQNSKKENKDKNSK